MSMLEALHLRKSYGEHVAVDDLSLKVGAGEVFGLIGPNGAGKTTTMMMLTGLLAPDSGAIQLGGRLFDRQDRKLRATLGVVPQDLAIYPDLTARENLVFFGRLYGLSGSDLKNRIAHVLDRTGLTQNAHEPARNFSGGMKRRLNFGVAILHGPQFVILDEPTVGVDPQSRSHLLDAIRELGAAGVGVIYATHYMEEIEAVCQRVAIVDHGRLLACGALDELLKGHNCELRVEISAIPERLIAQVQGLANVQRAGNGALTLRAVVDSERGPASLGVRLRQILDFVQTSGAEIRSVATEEFSLESLFLQLTGRSLRD